MQTKTLYAGLSECCITIILRTAMSFSNGLEGAFFSIMEKSVPQITLVKYNRCKLFLSCTYYKSLNNSKISRRICNSTRELKCVQATVLVNSDDETHSIAPSNTIYFSPLQEIKKKDEVWCYVWIIFVNQKQV